MSSIPAHLTTTQTLHAALRLTFAGALCRLACIISMIALAAFHGWVISKSRLPSKELDHMRTSGQTIQAEGRIICQTRETGADAAPVLVTANGEQYVFENAALPQVCGKGSGTAMPDRITAELIAVAPDAPAAYWPMNVKANGKSLVRDDQGLDRLNHKRHAALYELTLLVNLGVVAIGIIAIAIYATLSQAPQRGTAEKTKDQGTLS